MLETIQSESAVRVSADEYLNEFDDRFSKASGDLLKLERRQHFVEPGDDSWEAFARGEWTQALAYAENARPGIRSYNKDLQQRGVGVKRLRIIEWPLAPYVQWELNVLKVRAEEGDEIRIADAGEIEGHEQEAKLPEVVILGNRYVYEVLYDDRGALTGARRIENSRIVQECVKDFYGLFEIGTNLLAAFKSGLLNVEAPGDLTRA